MGQSHQPYDNMYKEILIKLVIHSFKNIKMPIDNIINIIKSMDKDNDGCISLGECGGKILELFKRW